MSKTNKVMTIGEPLNLPDAYVDCIIQHENGDQRLARLNHEKTRWEIYGHGVRAYSIWLVKHVVRWKVVEYYDTIPK